MAISAILASLFVLFSVGTASARSCSSLPNPLPFPTDLPIIEALPNPFKFFNNESVRSPEDWECRRAELKTLVQEYMYGYYPNHSLEHVTATRNGSQITINISVGENSTSFGATLSMPTSVNATPKAPVPVVISTDPVNNTVFLGSGIALATFSVNDVAADNIVPGGAFWDLYSGRDIGVITAWGWGFHRVLDAIEQVAPELDAKRVGAIGCSRDGKAALAAGIFDERITLTMPMSSGAEGIAPWRFQFQELGENEKITNITGAFPYWMNKNLINFVNNTHQIPFDAHLNAALVAPRAIIWDEGETDYWTNPEGEARVTFIGAKPVFEFLGVGDKVGVAIRDSFHCDIFGYTNIQAFMLNQFFGTPTDRNYSDISPYTLFPSAYPWLNDVPGNNH
ncbi:uncharacterized protein FOMMEDRAFT_187173 [Fomitiporia mediterranea MF3/22]|uniref:uncharacterized protein n=1 Tax=Fomitiporia mediterranea (strain MF3/22) TaxID=694068 RepID=UPI00044093F0|nr:uncharacterized protein FOMMEDRAFT_187173 [Fomitiporia mediterranea MF3/22]EJD04751.1 hypothetical protein FOMMEDRAFT_187173 [Fomitiporia mediterranea MF3/22]